MTIQFKKYVSRACLQPQMLLALSRIEQIYNKYGYSLTVTSTDDGHHSKNSLHYHGLACDIRSRELSDTDHANLNNDIRTKLTELDPKYQVVVESTHIHVEYDRRSNR